MKLSKVLHVVSVVVGFAGIVSFAGAVFGGADNLVFGITKADALACAASESPQKAMTVYNQS